jgi:uncharacterized protein (TIGR00297 family)
LWPVAHNTFDAGVAASLAKLIAIIVLPLAINPARLWTALAVTLLFAAAARLVRGVTRSGAAVGAVVAFFFYACGGPGAFAVLIALFAVTWLATRMGYTKKQRSGTAEKTDGRNAYQVLANLGIAAICIILFAVTAGGVYVVCFAAALAEAAADTVSSECGEALSDRARLITTFESVPAGTDGGVTIAGCVGGLIGATLISAACVAVALVPIRLLWLPAIAGTLGMLADSILGALLERRGALNNDAVNFLGTVIAAAFGAIFWKLI